MEPDKARKTVPLPVIKIITGAFYIPWKRRKRFAIALLVPTTLLLFISAITPSLFSAVSNSSYPNTMAAGNGQIIFFDPLSVYTLIAFVLLVVTIVAYLFIAIAAHRLILQGDDSVPPYGLKKWTWRETRFIAWCVVIGIVSFFIFLILIMLLNVFILPFSQEASRQQVLNIVNLIALLPITYIVSRWALIFPAIAIDERPGLGSAWELSGRNGWRLVITVGLIPWIFSWIRTTLLGFELTSSFFLFDQLLVIVALVVEISLLSLSYQALSVNRAEGAAESETLRT